MRVNATLRSDWEYITENAIFRSDREVPETEGRSLKENRRYSGLRNDRAYLNVDWVEGSSFMKSTFLGAAFTMTAKGWSKNL